MKLELTDQDVVTIGRALSYMPYGEVATLVNNLQTQINEQKKNDEPTTVE